VHYLCGCLRPEKNRYYGNVKCKRILFECTVSVDCYTALPLVKINLVCYVIVICTQTTIVIKKSYVLKGEFSKKKSA